MTQYQHFCHIFQKPALGTTFLRQYQVVNYSHRKLARGGDDSASCSIQCSAAEGERFFTDFIGNIVQFYVDNPNVPIWEGMITRIVLRTGGIIATTSLDEMSNSVKVVFYNSNSAAAIKTEMTAVATTPDSIAIYGTKQGTYDAGIHYNNLNKTHKTVLRDTLKTVRAYPQLSIASSDTMLATTIEIECKGLRDFAFGWQNYESTDTTLGTGSAVLSEITVRSDLALFPSNGALIYATGVAGSAALDNIATNAAFSISHESRSGQSYWQFIQSILEAGDGTAMYIFGITRAGLFNTTRYVYYQPPTTALKYVASAYKDVGYVRNTYGRIVPGYLVEPDAVIGLTDLFVNWAQPGNDPTQSYIEEINYDGNSGKVQWVSGDNMTIEAMLSQGRYFKKGQGIWQAPVRQVL